MDNMYTHTHTHIYITYIYHRSIVIEVHLDEDEHDKGVYRSQPQIPMNVELQQRQCVPIGPRTRQSGNV